MADKKTYPIALAHGIARFDFLTESFNAKSRELFGDTFDRFLLLLANFGLTVRPDSNHYFRGIQSFLKDDGFDVHHTKVGFATSLADRARDMKAELTRVLTATKADKVHVIAHSMGGLNTRAMIAQLGMAEKVASLTTIGTPHLGTSFADAKLTAGGNQLIEKVSRAIDLRGFQDLSRDACKKFNETIRNAEASNDVFYQTYAASEEREATFIFLQASWDIIKKAEGDNDGLVPLTSQAWQSEIVGDDGRRKKVHQKQFPVKADHLNEVGWWDLNELHGVKTLAPFGARERYETSIKEIYRDIARDLRERFPL
ncbi:MAG TPA: alpha/beta fold hydrolase [Pyrinomonadaceae bacterium]|jgi:triacylglycerol lipase